MVAQLWYNVDLYSTLWLVHPIIVGIQLLAGGLARSMTQSTVYFHRLPITSGHMPKIQSELLMDQFST